MPQYQPQVFRAAPSPQSYDGESGEEDDELLMMTEDEKRRFAAQLEGLEALRRGGARQSASGSPSRHDSHPPLPPRPQSRHQFTPSAATAAPPAPAPRRKSLVPEGLSSMSGQGYRATKDAEDASECTFQPHINRNYRPPLSSSYLDDAHDDSQVDSRMNNTPHEEEYTPHEGRVQPQPNGGGGGVLGARKLSTMSAGSAFSELSFFERNVRWMQQKKALANKTRTTRDEEASEECTFQPKINKLSAEWAKRKAEELQAHADEMDHQQAEAHRLQQLREFRSGGGGGGSDDVDHNAIEFSTAHLSSASPHRSTATSHDVTSRLYRDLQMRETRKLRQQEAVEKEMMSECTFAPRTCRKKWSASVQPRYLDAYAPVGEDGDATFNRSGAAGSLAGHYLGAAAADSNTSRGNVSVGTTSVSRSHPPAASHRSTSKTTNPEGYTFTPVVNDVSRIRKQYSQPTSRSTTPQNQSTTGSPPRSRSGGGGVVVQSFFSQANERPHSTSFAPSATTQGGGGGSGDINPQRLESYLSKPVHERLALDSSQRHIREVMRDEAATRRAQEEAHPATTLDMYLNKYRGSGGNKDDDREGDNEGDMTIAAPFLDRLETDIAKRERRRAALEAQLKSTTTPFKPHTNSEVNKFVKSSFQRSREESSGVGGGSSTSRQHSEATPRRTTTPSGTSTKPSHMSRTASTTTTSSSRVASAPTHQQREEEELKQCTFKPSICSTSAKSKFLKVEENNAKRAARLEVLRRELLAERERENEANADLFPTQHQPSSNRPTPNTSTFGHSPRRKEFLDASAFNNSPQQPNTNTRRPHTTPSATAPPPKRRSFTPSLSQGTKSILSGDRSVYYVSNNMESKLLTHETLSDPVKYKQYLKTLEARKAKDVARLREEQELAERAELTFKPQIHALPDYLLKSREATAAAGGGSKAHRRGAASTGDAEDFGPLPMRF